MKSQVVSPRPIIEEEDQEALRPALPIDEADVVTGGVADLVGLARPLIADPDLPLRLFRGERPRQAAPRRVGVGFLGAAAELLHQQRAIARMAADSCARASVSASPRGLPRAPR